MPNLPQADTPLAAAINALSFFSHLQLPPGNWACEYGGPLFLLPGLVISWYVTNTPIPEPIATEIKRYLFARQHPEDGGWGLHIEGASSVFGTAMNYVVLRLLGASAEDERVVKARGKLHQLGGAVNGPHWAKFWLSVLGVMEWDAVNPVPPEVWYVGDRIMIQVRRTDGREASSGLDAACTVALVGTYASGFFTHVIYIIQAFLLPFDTLDPTAPR